MIKRHKTRKIFYGDVPVGGGAEITIQSMTNTRTKNVADTVQQIRSLTESGCEIIRVAVPDMESARVLPEIKKKISIPLIADIHFDYKLAIKAVDNGIDGLRINPGNIGSRENIQAVVKKAREAGIPIRVGVNSGSLEQGILEEYGHPTAEAMVKSALNHIKILVDYNFHDIVISLKSTDVLTTIDAYTILAQKVDYPLHIGITEAGTASSGTVKSAIGIGSLLLRGLGDTIRVSLTGDPLEEVKVGWQILKSLKIRQRGPEIISCPGCGRTRINLEQIANEVEKKTANIDKNITIAVMGCAVNGPGEAREADIGIAGGKGEGLIFKKGEPLKKVKEGRLVQALLEEIDKM